MANLQETVVRIVLPAGDPGGIRIAEVHLPEVRTTILHAIVFPRERLREFRQNPDWIKRRTVYLLVGRGDEAAKPDVYIGQSFKPGERLYNHDRDPDKNFWEMTVVAISSATPFSLDDIGWLECQCIQKAREADRFEVHADRNPDPEAVRDSGGLSTVLEGLTTLVSVLGYSVFEPADIDVPAEEGTLPPTTASGMTFFCRGGGADAAGRVIEGGFEVNKGSIIRCGIAPSARETVGASRQKLVDSRVIVEEAGKLVFARNHSFRSPSGAAAIVLGRNADGWMEWEDEHGKTLDEIMRPGGDE